MKWATVAVFGVVMWWVGAGVEMSYSIFGSFGTAGTFALGNCARYESICCCMSLMCASSCSLRAMRDSTSCRLRSRELCAARRLRLTRSIRRCSFSSAVFARFRGGRFVFGSGRTWPHDLRFFVVFESAALKAESAEGTSSNDDDNAAVVDVTSSILMV